MAFSDPVFTLSRRSATRDRTIEIRPWHLLGVAIGAGLVQAAIGVFGLALPVDLGVFEAPRRRVERRVLELESSFEAVGRGESQARKRAGLDPIGEGLRKLGVGGALAPPIADPLEERLHRLALDCELKKASYREIVRRLKARRELWERIPLMCPVPTAYVSSRFGYRIDPFTNQPDFHPGLDLRADSGNPVYAAANGVVKSAGPQSGYGLLVIIDHENGLESRYAHAGRLLVAEGDLVKRGQLIAYVGSSGRTTAPHLHYEVRRGGEALDPVRFMAATPGEPE